LIKLLSELWGGVLGAKEVKGARMARSLWILIRSEWKQVLDVSIIEPGVPKRHLAASGSLWMVESDFDLHLETFSRL